MAAIVAIALRKVASTTLRTSLPAVPSRERATGIRQQRPGRQRKAMEDRGTANLMYEYLLVRNNEKRLGTY